MMETKEKIRGLTSANDNVHISLCQGFDALIKLFVRPLYLNSFLFEKTLGGDLWKELETIYS